MNTRQRLTCILKDGVNDDLIKLLRLYFAKLGSMKSSAMEEDVIKQFKHIVDSVVAPYGNEHVRVLLFRHLIMSTLSTIWEKKLKYSRMAGGNWSHELCEEAQDAEEIDYDMTRFCYLNHMANFLYIHQKLYFANNSEYILPLNLFNRFYKYWEMYEDYGIVKAKIQKAIKKTIDLMDE